MDNLLTNAAVHGRPAGRVDVTVPVEPGASRILVADDGQGMPAAAREAMRGRFVRSETSRSPGSGLGLALVEQQVQLHGGRMELGESASGGLLATLILPSAAR